MKRLKQEFGYKSVKAWPIFERENGGAIMYYRIHATDHPEGPKFMSRAYRRAVLPSEPIEQLKLTGILDEPDDTDAEISRMIYSAPTEG